METKDREMEEIVRDAHQLIEELRQGNPWERAVKRMASKCFNMGMAAIPPHKSAQADSDGCGKNENTAGTADDCSIVYSSRHPLYINSV